MVGHPNISVVSGILSVGNPSFSVVSELLSVVGIPPVAIPIAEKIQLLMYGPTLYILFYYKYYYIIILFTRPKINKNIFKILEQIVILQMNAKIELFIK